MVDEFGPIDSHATVAALGFGRTLDSRTAGRSCCSAWNFCAPIAILRALEESWPRSRVSDKAASATRYAARGSLALR